MVSKLIEKYKNQVIILHNNINKMVRSHIIDQDKMVVWRIKKRVLNSIIKDLNDVISEVSE